MTAPFNLPLRLACGGGVIGIEDADGTLVATIYCGPGGDGEWSNTVTRAEYIVRAVNAHEALMKAAKIAAAVMARENAPMTVDEIMSIHKAAVLAEDGGSDD